MLKWRIRRDLSWQKFANLFAQAQEGDEEAKEQVFSFLRTRLLVLARYRVPEVAEDAVHESLVVVHNHFEEFESLGGLLGFSHQVLRNKIGNIYQGRSRQKFVDLEVAELRYQIQDKLEAGELDEIVRESINKIGESRPVCHAILSGLYHGFDPDEISQKLGISKSKLKVQTFRCREALRVVLRREYSLEV